MSARAAPPSGHPPPDRALRPDGGWVELAGPAAEVTRRYAAEFPDEPERYGDAWAQWCRHDNQHLLHWAYEDLSGRIDLDTQLDWLVSVLRARDYPVERMPRDLELCAQVMGERGEAAVAQRLRAAAARLARA